MLKEGGEVERERESREEERKVGSVKVEGRVEREE